MASKQRSFVGIEDNTLHGPAMLVFQYRKFCLTCTGKAGLQQDKIN
jgi:hypothetical protein